MKFRYNAHYYYQNMADELIESAAERLGYVLKEGQRKVVSSFVSGEDVLVYSHARNSAPPKAVQVIEQLACMLWS